MLVAHAGESRTGVGVTVAGPGADLVVHFIFVFCYVLFAAENVKCSERS